MGRSESGCGAGEWEPSGVCTPGVHLAGSHLGVCQPGPLKESEEHGWGRLTLSGLRAETSVGKTVASLLHVEQLFLEDRPRVLWG